MTGMLFRRMCRDMAIVAAVCAALLAVAAGMYFLYDSRNMLGAADALFGSMPRWARSALGCVPVTDMHRFGEWLLRLGLPAYAAACAGAMFAGTDMLYPWEKSGFSDLLRSLPVSGMTVLLRILLCGLCGIAAADILLCGICAALLAVFGTPHDILILTACILRMALIQLVLFLAGTACGAVLRRRAAFAAAAGFLILGTACGTLGDAGLLPAVFSLPGILRYGMPEPSAVSGAGFGVLRSVVLAAAGAVSGTAACAGLSARMPYEKRTKK